MPTVSFNTAQSSLGLMIGLCSKRGGYIKAVSDFNFSLNPSLSTNGDGLVAGSHAWFTGRSERSRYSITAGYLRKIAPPLYIFAGAGYGRRILAWEFFAGGEKYDFAKVNPNSFTGTEAELGAILRIRGLALSAGVQTISFKYYEASIGVGIMF